MHRASQIACKMVNIGTQTLGSKPLGKGPVVFISSIKNENAFTQCYIPLGTDACTLAEDLAIDSLSSVVKERNTTTLNIRKRRGRPRKNPILIDDSFRIKTGSNISEGHTGKFTDELALNRVKRERKVPIKFDPSDINKTKATSLPAPESLLRSEVEETEYDGENDKPLESDSDWTSEEFSTSTAYDSDDQLHNIFQIPEGSSKKDLTTKCLQENLVSQVFNGQSAEKKVSESDFADKGTIDEININEGKIYRTHLQKDKRKRIVDLSRNKRQVKRKKMCRPYSCKHCNIDFTVFSVYTKHMLNHEIAQGKHSVTCKVCGKILSSRVNLRRHMMIHKGKPFTCEMCGKGFTGRYLLREHLTVEHNKITSNTQIPTNHQCYACKKYMSTKTALQYHQACLHSCVKCEKKWPCKTSLREHVLQVHDQVNVTKEGRLECSYCNKTFNYRYHYLNHVAHHSNEKNFICQKCKKGFLTRQALYCHTKQVHEKYNYRYPCSFCEKVFICNAKLVEHVRTHTGEKPFECTLCSVAFAAKATYKSHMNLIHSPTAKQRRGKRSKATPLHYEYNCPLCDIKDLRADDLEGHCWNVHNATVQFSYEMPEKLTTQDPIVLDGSRKIVLSNKNIAGGEVSKQMPEKLPAEDTIVLGKKKNVVVSNKNIAAIEASREIVVSEGSTEIVVSDGTTDIFLLEESKEIVVAREENVNLTVSSENEIVHEGN